MWPEFILLITAGAFGSAFVIAVIAVLKKRWNLSKSAAIVGVLISALYGASVIVVVVSVVYGTALVGAGLTAPERFMADGDPIEWV